MAGSWTFPERFNWSAATTEAGSDQWRGAEWPLPRGPFVEELCRVEARQRVPDAIVACTDPLSKIIAVSILSDRVRTWLAGNGKPPFKRRRLFWPFAIRRKRGGLEGHVGAGHLPPVGPPGCRGEADAAGAAAPAGHLAEDQPDAQRERGSEGSVSGRSRGGRRQQEQCS
eukprot:scaffold149_cov315-Pinguiococcus_pyrenoidosus.AAC.108